MKTTVDGGRALLEASAAEVRALYQAVEREVEYHEGRAARMTYDAEDAERDADRVRGARTKKMRYAGELRNEAAAHRAFARDAGDLLRVLRELTTGTDLR